MLPLVTQTDVELAFTTKLVREIFVDDGGREVGPRLQMAIQAASDEAAALLGKVSAWRDPESLIRFIQDDAAARHAVCKLVMAIGIDARPSWFNESGPGVNWRRDARLTLNDLAQRNGRSPAESTVGENTVIFPQSVNAQQFEFARRRGRDSSGGGY